MADVKMPIFIDRTHFTDSAVCESTLSLSLSFLCGRFKLLLTVACPNKPGMVHASF
jgi:hypothetical protein